MRVTLQISFLFFKELFCFIFRLVEFTLFLDKVIFGESRAPPGRVGILIFTGDIRSDKGGDF